MHCPFCGISIHSLRMEGDPAAIYVHHRKAISIHSLRMEGDRFNTSCAARCSNFNPLPPHGGRPAVAEKTQNNVVFQSTPSAWRETRFFARQQLELPISIHSLRMEGDCIAAAEEIVLILFQSTPSAWRETSSFSGGSQNFAFQSTPSAWRETTIIAVQFRSRTISIHSLRMEGDDPLSGFINLVSTLFQSTPSAWRETSVSHIITNFLYYFNPLPPHGGRRFRRGGGKK